MKILLRWEKANPNKLDNDSKTLLSYAIEGRYADIVKILLGQKEVTSDKPEYY